MFPSFSSLLSPRFLIWDLFWLAFLSLFPLHQHLFFSTPAFSYSCSYSSLLIYAFPPPFGTILLVPPFFFWCILLVAPPLYSLISLICISSPFFLHYFSLFTLSLLLLHFLLMLLPHPFPPDLPQPLPSFFSVPFVSGVLAPPPQERCPRKRGSSPG